jgi:ADP-ribose pyrophosphatase YjhB (NUDIX family)
VIVVDVEGAVFRDGRYLMIVRGQNESHAPGALSFPGGKLEKDDGPEDALESTLRREIAKESGVTVLDEMTYVDSGLFDMDDGRKALAVVFLCYYAAGEPRPGDDEQSVHWMTPHEIESDPRAGRWLQEMVPVVEAVRQGAKSP